MRYCSRRCETISDKSKRIKEFNLVSSFRGTVHLSGETRATEEPSVM